MELSYVEGDVDSKKLVKHDTGRVTIRTFLALIWSEITGLAMGAFVLAYWRSYLSFIWFLPLALKLLSAVFTIQREGLLAKPSQKEQSLRNIKRLEVNTKGHGVLVVEGIESVVLQFFRHYGHPIRNRVREFMQITIIVASGFVFPIGLVVSLVWMPIGMQYAWLGYQLYATTAMYIYRYTRQQSATTESRLAQVLAQGRTEEQAVYLLDDSGTIVMGKLTRTPVGSYAEGQDVLKSIMSQKPAVLPNKKVDLDGRKVDESDALSSTPNDSDSKP